ncbi:MAG TPA: hypothetical protein PLD08_06095, partial [Acetomicrobium flavidum]|nr:hypothetical protein [Acetomicrobium flavidum]
MGSYERQGVPAQCAFWQPEGRTQGSKGFRMHECGTRILSGPHWRPNAAIMGETSLLARIIKWMIARNQWISSIAGIIRNCLKNLRNLKTS